MPYNLEDFPFQWEKDVDQNKSWIQDDMHAPNPFTPMARVIQGYSMARGYDHAFKVLHYPLRCEVKFFNTYYYLTIYSNTTPEEFAAKNQESEVALEEALSRFRLDWHEKFLPEIVEHTEFVENFNCKTASMTALIDHFKESIKRIDHLWEIHFIIAVLMFAAPSLFQEYYKDLFPEASEFEALELLEGFENQSMQLGIELWRLSREAMKDKEIERILKEYPPHNVEAKLQMTQAGWDYLAKIQIVLEKYGKRCEESLELTQKSWLEDFSKPIKNIQNYLDPKALDVENHLKRLKERRDKHLTVVRETLKNYPAEVTNRFEMLLDAAITAFILQEDHNYVLDQRIIYMIRKVLLEIGRRFVLAKTLDQADDIMYLFPEEVIEGVKKLPQAELRPLVSKRKSEMEHFGKVSPPLIIGSPSVPFSVDNPLNRGIEKFFGGPPKTSTQPNVLLGNSASPGVVHGVARLIKNLEDAKRMKPGDILVAKTTSTSWTPFFGVIKAVVTGTGGILCHCAIVAREYGIPAVIGLHADISKIKEGDTIEVNGDTGTVTLLGQEGEADT